MTDPVGFAGRNLEKGNGSQNYVDSGKYADRAVRRTYRRYQRFFGGGRKQAMECPEIEQIYGAKNGVEGILRENIIDLRTLLRSEEDFARLRATPAMALGSCRKRLAEQPDREYDALREILLRRNIRYFFYIGGNRFHGRRKKSFQRISSLWETRFG